MTGPKNLPRVKAAATNGESSGSASQDDKKKSVTEEEDVYEPYRKEYRDMLKNPPNRTISDKMRVYERASKFDRSRKKRFNGEVRKNEI